MAGVIARVLDPLDSSIHQRCPMDLRTELKPLMDSALSLLLRAPGPGAHTVSFHKGRQLECSTEDMMKECGEFWSR